MVSVQLPVPVPITNSTYWYQLYWSSTSTPNQNCPLREMERVVIDNGEDVLLNLKKPNKRVRDPDSNNALVIEFNTEEDLEVEIPKLHSKTDAKNYVVCLDLKNLAGARLTIDVDVLGDESNLKEVRVKNSTRNWSQIEQLI